MPPARIVETAYVKATEVNDEQYDRLREYVFTAGLLEDGRRGYYDRTVAKECYGVVITEDGFEVMEKETAARRSALKRKEAEEE